MRPFRGVFLACVRFIPVTTPAFPGQELLDRTSAAASPRTLIDILAEVAARHPEASAIDDGSGALSYRELLAHVWRTAASLHEAGVRRGDRVGVRMPSGSKELYVSILAVMAAGAAYVPVDADDPDERARLVFGEAGVRGIIAGDGEFVAAGDALVRLYDGDAPHPSTNAVPIVAPPTVDDARAEPPGIAMELTRSAMFSNFYFDSIVARSAGCGRSGDRSVLLICLLFFL